jgi:hypothetical protein
VVRSCAKRLERVRVCFACLALALPFYAYSITFLPCLYTCLFPLILSCLVLSCLVLPCLALPYRLLDPGDPGHLLTLVSLHSCHWFALRIRLSACQHQLTRSVLCVYSLPSSCCYLSIATCSLHIVFNTLLGHPSGRPSAYCKSGGNESHHSF